MILYRDNNWLVVDKPCGMATHAGNPGELGVAEWLQLHLGLETHIVSRLDRETSGALLLALHPKASGQAQKIHEEGTAEKTYVFFSKIDPRTLGLSGTWQCQQEIDSKSASTSFRLISHDLEGPLPFFKYEARITRGRKHQIRRHAAALGFPILGDTEYGGASFPRLCLHCRQVIWPGLEEPIISAEPESFQTLSTNKPIFLQRQFAVTTDRRGRWLLAITDAFRAIHRGELSSLPVAVDIYGKYFNAVWFDETTEADEVQQKLTPLLDLVSAKWGTIGGVIRIHRRNPHKRQLVTETILVGENPPDYFTVQEHGLQYEVSLTQTQHTGLFLDQRDSRQRLSLLAKNKRLANLFAFTASFSLAAVAAGAEVAFSVDTAKACLNTGKKNFGLNNLAELRKGKFIQEDARRWLKRQIRKHQENPAVFVPLDLVVCDPPVFASAKDGGKFSLEEEWPFLAAGVATVLADDGVAIFANNHRAGHHRFYRSELISQFTSVIDLRPPMDFPVQKNQPHHVRTFLCTKSG